MVSFTEAKRLVDELSWRNGYDLDSLYLQIYSLCEPSYKVCVIFCKTSLLNIAIDHLRDSSCSGIRRVLLLKVVSTISRVEESRKFLAIDLRMFEQALRGLGETTGEAIDLEICANYCSLLAIFADDSELVKAFAEKYQVSVLTGNLFSGAMTFSTCYAESSEVVAVESVRVALQSVYRIVSLTQKLASHFVLGQGNQEALIYLLTAPRAVACAAIFHPVTSIVRSVELAGNLRKELVEVLFGLLFTAAAQGNPELVLKHNFELNLENTAALIELCDCLSSLARKMHSAIPALVAQSDPSLPLLWRCWNEQGDESLCHACIRVSAEFLFPAPNPSTALNGGPLVYRAALCYWKSEPLHRYLCRLIAQIRPSYGFTNQVIDVIVTSLCGQKNNNDVTELYCQAIKHVTVDIEDEERRLKLVSDTTNLLANGIIKVKPISSALLAFQTDLLAQLVLVEKFPVPEISLIACWEAIKGAVEDGANGKCEQVAENCMRIIKKALPSVAEITKAYLNSQVSTQPGFHLPKETLGRDFLLKVANLCKTANRKRRELGGVPVVSLYFEKIPCDFIDGSLVVEVWDSLVVDVNQGDDPVGCAAAVALLRRAENFYFSGTNILSLNAQILQPWWGRIENTRQIEFSEMPRLFAAIRSTKFVLSEPSGRKIAELPTAERSALFKGIASLLPHIWNLCAKPHELRDLCPALLLEILSLLVIASSPGKSPITCNTLGSIALGDFLVNFMRPVAPVFSGETFVEGFDSDAALDLIVRIVKNSQEGGWFGQSMFNALEQLMVEESLFVMSEKSTELIVELLSSKAMRPWCQPLPISMCRKSAKVFDTKRKFKHAHADTVAKLAAILRILLDGSDEFKRFPIK